VMGKVGASWIGYYFDWNEFLLNSSNRYS
jgi:hypothetical protein